MRNAQMSSLLNEISSLFIPIIIIGVIVYGIYKKAPVYDYFTAGAKDGLKTCVEMIPFIIAIFIGIEAITSSGAMEFFQKTHRSLYGTHRASAGTHFDHTSPPRIRKRLYRARRKAYAYIWHRQPRRHKCQRYGRLV